VVFIIGIAGPKRRERPDDALHEYVEYNFDRPTTGTVLRIFDFYISASITASQWFRQKGHRSTFDDRQESNLRGNSKTSAQDGKVAGQTQNYSRHLGRYAGRLTRPTILSKWPIARFRRVCTRTLSLTFAQGNSSDRSL